jgi:hypothetical protein
MTTNLSEKPAPQKDKVKSYKSLYIIIGIVIAVIVFLIILRPGVYTIHPRTYEYTVGEDVTIGGTIIYYSRNKNSPFFSSPDGTCLNIEDNALGMDFCRKFAIFGFIDQKGHRILLNLPYSEWAFLQSTGGREYAP